MTDLVSLTAIGDSSTPELLSVLLHRDTVSRLVLLWIETPCLARLADVFQDHVDGLTLVTLLLVLVITILFEDGLVWVAESIKTAVVRHRRFTINMYLDMNPKSAFMLLPPSLCPF